jgi:porphobilinogen synthase
MAFHFLERPRRNRRTESIRSLVRETSLSPRHLIWPAFVQEDSNEPVPISAMPGVSRWPLKKLVAEAKQMFALGIPAIALFPALAEKFKDSKATHSTAKDGLLQRTIRELKETVPEMLVITDVAMDPYSSDGHDGLVKDGKILNDETLPILAQMAISQAAAGADWVAPSDMMDGRVAVIREALDASSFHDTGILSYSVKYASSFYGPFREALDSAPRAGDKKTYQMDPANRREGMREVRLDIEEGADVVMVKPALAFLDVIAEVKASVDVPVAAYNVSGEYAMVKAAAQNGWLDGDRAALEVLTSIRRAGADMILSYHAPEVAKLLNR